jgi:WhiB family redox-sensing transcriptional regulator
MKENEQIQLTSLMDLSRHAGHGAADIPCQRFDAALWFAENPADVDLAKALCAECPVRSQCLAGAVARKEPWGVWGGELFVRGAIAARKRPRGRPRRNAIAA